MRPSRHLIPPAAALVALAVAAPVAAAKLVYVKDPDAAPGQPTVWLAEDDGTRARKVGDGSYPQISADGRTLLHYANYGHNLVVRGTARRARPHEVVSRAGEIDTPRLSADGKLAAAVVDGQLRVFATGSGRARILARGEIDAISFAPDGRHLAFSRRTGAQSDVFRMSVEGGRERRLTEDGRSLLPVWGPGRIAFVKRERGGDLDIWTMTSRGRRVRRVTRTTAAAGSGLAPVEWSADGRRLLGQYLAGELRVGFTVDPFSGDLRAIRRRVAFDLSADGTTVLTQSGGATPEGRHSIYASPWAGGRGKLLVRDAAFPDWSR